MVNTPKCGLWTNKIVKTKLPIEYNRKYKLSQDERAEIVETETEQAAQEYIRYVDLAIKQREKGK